MTFVEKLRRSRLEPVLSAAVMKADRIGGAPAADLVAPLAPVNGARPAPTSSKGLGGAALRRAVEDLFVVADSLKLPGPLVARFAVGLDAELGLLKALDDAIVDGWANQPEPQKSVLLSIPARILRAASDGLLALDGAQRSQAIHGVLEGLIDLARGPGAPNVRALEAFAHTIAKLHAPEMGQQIREAFERIRAIGDAPALEAANDALAAKIDVIFSSGDDRAKAPMVSAALDIVLSLAADANLDGARAAEAAIAKLTDAGLPITDGQRRILGELAGEMRRVEGQYRQAEEQRKVRGDQQLANYDAQANGANRAKLQPLAATRDLANATLSLEGRALWFERMSLNMAQPPAVLEAIGRIHFELLAQRVDGVPNANALQAIEQALVQLAGAQGISPDALAQIAEKHVRTQFSDKLPKIFAALASTQTELFQRRQDLRDPGLLALLADAYAARPDAFSAANGSRTVIVGALAAAPDEATRHYIARFGVPLAQAVWASEAGATHNQLAATFHDDMIELQKHGTNLAALAAAYRAIPEDSLASLAAMGVRYQFDLDKWFGRLAQLFALARGNKDSLRSLRSVLVLADKGGANAPQLLEALLTANMRPQVLIKTVNAILREDNHNVTRDQVERVIAELQRGEDVATAIEEKLHAAMVRKLNLANILKNAKVDVTEEGFAAVQGPLAQFFATAANQQQFDKELLKQLLISVLEGRFPSFRFTTKATERALKSLDAEQQRLWQKHETMTHVRFQGDGQKEFDRRVKAAASIGKTLVGRMKEAWGDIDQLRKKHRDLVKQIRNVQKGDVAGRKRLLKEINGLPAKVSAFEWAEELAAMTPETTTPLRFAEMAQILPSLGRELGPRMRAVVEELVWTIRLDDLSYSQVITHDGPSLEMMLKLVSGTCIAGPADSAFLAYCIDPNKRMIYTKNERGETRRAVLRLVERQDQGHVGEPMLLLECPYPRGTTTQEERQRLIEHALRRATEMGIPAAYPTEYYWDASKTGRFNGQVVNDMNAVIEDLNRRYGTTNEKKAVRVVSPAGNMPQEYIDSAPTRGAAGAGNAEVRRYPGTQDNAYENLFVILSPKSIE